MSTIKYGAWSRLGVGSLSLILLHCAKPAVPTNCPSAPNASVTNSTSTPKDAEVRATISRPKWLGVDGLQASGIAVMGGEFYVIGDRSSKEKNTVAVFARDAYAQAEDTLAPVRKMVLDVEHPALRDPFKRKFYEARVCGVGSCEVLDAEDLAVDSAGAIYVAVEGKPDAIIKFDPTSHKPVDVWQQATGDTGGLGAEGLGLAPDGELMFIGRQSPPVLSIHDTRTGWESRGPVDVRQINGLAYDPLRHSLLVLDGIQRELVSVALDGSMGPRYALGAELEVGPDGRSYTGCKLDGIAIEPGGKAAWLVTDPPRDNPQYPYKPTQGDVSEPFVKTRSMLYRVDFVPVTKGSK